jgi:hypothetical protein
MRMPGKQVIPDILTFHPNVKVPQRLKPETLLT